MSKSQGLAEDQKHYELMAIIDADIGENAIKEKVKKIRSLVEDNGGSFTSELLWGVKNLAYTIKKKSLGYYAILDFMLDPEKLAEIDRVLRLDQEMLRHLLVVLPKQYVLKEYTEEVKTEEVKEEKKFEAKPKHAGTKTFEKKETPVEEPKKPAKKKENAKQSLEDIDKKLEKIIDNPDINI